MRRDWIVDIVSRLPQATLSRAWGWLTRCRRPRIGVELAKRAFVAGAGIDMSEAAKSVDGYPTLEALFTRELRAGVRPIEPSSDAVVSPVDGTVGASGVIEQGLAFQVKGRSYSLAKLLGSSEESRRFEGGSFASFYLAPHNYHRVHAPVTGAIVGARVIPGSLMPVFHEALESVDELFARNERLVTIIADKEGRLTAVVKVGATLVGRISVEYDKTLRSNDRNLRSYRRSYDPPIPVDKGEALGMFEFGSSVVVVFEAGQMELNDLESGGSCRMGERIGSLVASSRKKKKKAKRVSKKGKTTRSTTRKAPSRVKTSTKKTHGATRSPPDDDREES